MSRLYVGSTIFDSADTSSSSTISGVQLDVGTLGVDFMPQVSGQEYRWPVFHGVITAANEGALKTAIESVRAAIENASGKTILYEETNGTTLFHMHANVWPVCEGGIEFEPGDLTADFSFSFVGRRPGPVGAGTADEAGIVIAPNWQHDSSAGGKSAILARATFGPTMSGDTVSSGSRQNAVAWINKMKTSSNWTTVAPFISTQFRFAGALTNFDQRMNVATLSEADYQPATVELRFTKMDATLHADATLPASCVEANMNTQAAPRPAINARAGVNPGTDITLFGTFVLKTEADTGFNSSDSALADNAIKTAAEATVNAIISMFRTVMTGVALTQWGLPVIDMDPINGAFGYRVRFTADAPILQWRERTIVRAVQARVRSRATNGKRWSYTMAGGPERTLYHSLTIEAETPIPYRLPQIGGSWEEDEASAEPTITMNEDNGGQTFITFAERYFTQKASSGSGTPGFALTPGEVGVNDLLASISSGAGLAP